MAAAQLAAEERVVLRNVSWDTYEGLMRDHEHISAPRFTYDRGTLEIMSPLPVREHYNRLLETLMFMVAEELDIEVYSLGSTTYKREEFLRGFEADSCFYIQHEAAVRGKDRLDLSVDPPPDVVFEIDITHSSLAKLAIYAQFGVPEVWRFNGERFAILIRQEDGYVERARSEALPAIMSDALFALLRDSAGLSTLGWSRRVRAWLRRLADTSDG